MCLPETKRGTADRTSRRRRRRRARTAPAAAPTLLLLSALLLSFRRPADSSSGGVMAFSPSPLGLAWRSTPAATATARSKSTAASSSIVSRGAHPPARPQDRVPWPDRRPSPQGGDMAYVKENVERQANNYGAIRSAGGVECVSDLYVRNPKVPERFWYVGKVARCTGTVSLNEAVARQLNLIEEHATRLRPVELGRAFGSCEVWAAPGDTEVRLSENDPDVRLEKLDRYVEGCEDVDGREVGLTLEVVTNRGVGFFVERDENGSVPPNLLP